MTAVYTLAHSCLQSDSSPLSVSPSSLNSNSGIARRSSLSRSQQQSLHHHNGSLNSGYQYHHHHHPSPSAYSSHQQLLHGSPAPSPAVPVNIGPGHVGTTTSFNPVSAPVLSVSPQSAAAKQRAHTTSSFSSSLSSNATATAKSGLSNLLQHHAAASPTLASTVAPAAPPAIRSTVQQQPAPPLPYIHSLSVIDTFEQVLSEVDIDSCDAAGENAFLVCDLGRVYAQYQLWQKELGSRIEAFFAVKCNPDPLIIKLMVSLGIGFDCASHQEISTVLKAGAVPNKIIYANPCKASSFIRHASKSNIDMMTFDNSDELEKVSKFHKNAKMVLRILTDDSGSLCKLGLKFGSPLGEVRSLLLKAKELNVDVIGISFHVGSGCTNPLLFGDAVARAKWAFKVGESLGFKFTLLDVGGGFGGDNFVEIAGILREAIEEHFPASEGVRVIAEPGRYFVSDAFEMATNIIARRGKGGGSQQLGSSYSEEMDGVSDDQEAEEEEESMVMYYINDGVYGAFNCTMFDHQVVHPKVLTSEGVFVSSPSTYFSEPKESHVTPRITEEACSIWGPTCDSIDCVSSKTYLPVSKLKVGDWLRWENMGAYTICAASQFNGFKQSKVVYTIFDGEEGRNGRTERTIRELLNR